MLTFLFYSVSREDLRTKQIPDEAALAICIMAVGKGGFSSGCVCLGLAVMILTGLVTGMGDAKLFGSLTLLLGPAVFRVIIMSFLLAGPYCLLRLLKGELKAADTVAFAPFIAAPAITIFINNMI